MESKHCKLGELKRRKSGQSTCKICDKSYNNASVPEYCSNEACKLWLGGKFTPKLSQIKAFMITESLASVRIREKGLSIRTFVSIGLTKKVSPLLDNKEKQQLN